MTANSDPSIKRQRQSTVFAVKKSARRSYFAYKNVEHIDDCFERYHVLNKKKILS